MTATPEDGDHHARPPDRNDPARDSSGPGSGRPQSCRPPVRVVREATPEVLFAVAERLKRRVLDDISDVIRRVIDGIPPDPDARTDLGAVVAIGMGPAVLAEAAERATQHLFDCFPRALVLAPPRPDAARWPHEIISVSLHLLAARDLIEQVRVQAVNDDALGMLWLSEDDVEAFWIRYPELAAACTEDDEDSWVPEVPGTLGPVGELDAVAILTHHRCWWNVSDQLGVYVEMVERYRRIAQDLREQFDAAALRW